MKKLIAALVLASVLVATGCAVSSSQSSASGGASQAASSAASQTSSSDSQAASSDSQAVSNDSQAASSDAIADNETASTDSAQQAESSDESASGEAAVEEDGQNPVMNFIGPYACDRATMEVSASGSDDAAITITWGSSADTASEWVLSGYFDTDTLTVNYSNAVKTNYVYNPDGSIKSQEVEYSDGSGRIVFHNGSELTCTWENENEPENGAMEFTWNF